MIARAVLFALVALAATVSARAAEIVVPAEAGALARALTAAQAGDVLRLRPGVHRGPVLIDRPLTLAGEPGAAVDGGGSGSAITVDAPDAAVTGLEIRGSGDSHETIDSGVKLTRKATRARVVGNRLIGNLYGIDIHGARDALVADNVIVGRDDRRMNARGNGVYVWNAPGARVENNRIRLGRDGIFVNASKRNVFRGNRMENLRFAIHYMYADDSEVSGNVSIGNHLGYAIMFSTRVEIRGNASIGDRDHGIMLNYANRSAIEGNLVRDGGDKCLFMYNANRNLVTGNRFERCRIGIHFTAGSADNRIFGNAFIGNRTQVKNVGTKMHEWSENGRGNYWSDHAAYDIDGDGIADQPFRPNDRIDRILWTQPAARLLLGSPAVQLIRWAQGAFPALLPGGVIDSAPLMRPVMPAIAAKVSGAAAAGAGAGAPPREPRS